MSFTRALSNIKKSRDWERKLVRANDYLYSDLESLEDAVKRYGKMLEILLRRLYKELSMVVSPQKKAEMIALENKVGKGKKPIGEFGLGQYIRIFRDAGLFDLLNKSLKTELFDENKLFRINNFRVDQTHYDEEVIKNEAEKLREYLTGVLLKLGLINRDPEEYRVKTEEKAPPSRREITRKTRLHMTRRIRLGVASGTDTLVEESYDVESGDGWFSTVEMKAEIVGIYLDKDKDFTVLVRVLEANMPESFLAGREEEEAYSKLILKVRETIEKIEPAVKGDLKILLYNETNGSELEGAAYAYFQSNEGAYIQ